MVQQVHTPLLLEQSSRSAGVLALQEPLQQTVRLVHVAFEALLDVLEMQRDHAGVLGVLPEEAADVARFLEDTARDIMRIGGAK